VPQARSENSGSDRKDKVLRMAEDWLKLARTPAISREGRHTS